MIKDVRLRGWSGHTFNGGTDRRKKQTAGDLILGYQLLNLYFQQAAHTLAGEKRMS